MVKVEKTPKAESAKSGKSGTKFRCTECETEHPTFRAASKCHWGIGGVEEVGRG